MTDPRPDAPDGSDGRDGSPTREVGLIEGRTSVLAALQACLVQACEQGERELRWIAASFDDWPLDDAALLQALVRWARPPGRHLLLVGRDFDRLARCHPRFAAWRRDWSHRFEARQPGEQERLELPTFMVSGSSAFELIDLERWRARRPSAAADLHRLREEFDAISQRCEPAWPATTLGL